MEGTLGRGEREGGIVYKATVYTQENYVYIEGVSTYIPNLIQEGGFVKVYMSDFD